MSPAPARFALDDSDEVDVPAPADYSVPAFCENIDEKRPVFGTICATGFDSESLSAVMETTGQSGETVLERRENTVQLLEWGVDRTQLLATFETVDTTSESCQQRKLLGLSTMADVQRNSSSLGKLQRRNFSGVLSIILAADQHLDASCADSWS